jgi:hypothetical protein
VTPPADAGWYEEDLGDLSDRELIERTYRSLMFLHAKVSIMSLKIPQPL